MMKTKMTMMFSSHGYFMAGIAAVVCVLMSSANQCIIVVTSSTAEAEVPLHTNEVVSQLVKCISCPVSHSIFAEPWLANDGHTYERAVLRRLIESPMTRQSIQLRLCKPNTQVFSFIQWILKRDRQHPIDDISRWLDDGEKLRRREASSDTVSSVNCSLLKWVILV